jgi:hypothetical protein
MLDRSPAMDLLVKRIHYTRLNAIIKPDIILARGWYCMIDKCNKKLTKIRSGHLHVF